MHDHPDPEELLAAAALFVRDELVPALPPDLSFKARVLANALDLVARQVTEDERVAADNHTRLTALLGSEGPEDALTAELVRRIEAGEIAPRETGLIAHLWTTTLAKLAVDQPEYASYRAEAGIADR